MRIASLHIQNFRAVRHLQMSDMPDAVVIAGSNGCGKSSVFDAIRLLKSAYGQYHQNELAQWFNEAQINIQKIAQEAAVVLYDPTMPMVITAEIELATGRARLPRNEWRSSNQSINWAQTFVRGPVEHATVVSPTGRRARKRVANRASAEMAKALSKELPAPKFLAKLTMTPSGDVDIAPSAVLELAFSMFEPAHLGIVDYHGPYRHYGREPLGGINLSIEDASAKYSQHALYNTQNKYTNVKSEMARSFIRQLLAKEAGLPKPDQGDLIETLHELFEIFFPGKRFLGLIPTKRVGYLFR